MGTSTKQELLEEVKNLYPDGSEFQTEWKGRYNSIYITPPEGEIGPLRPEKTLRRRGFDVYAGNSNRGRGKNKFYVHQM